MSNRNMNDSIDSIMGDMLGDEKPLISKKKIKTKKAKQALPTFMHKIDVETKLPSEEGGFAGTHDDGKYEDIDNDFYSEIYEDASEKSDLSRRMQAVVDWEPQNPRSSSDEVLNEWITSGWVGLLHIDKILTEAIITGASDVHITTDQRISMSLNGEIIRYDEFIVPDNETMHMLIHEGILSHQELAAFNKDYEYDGSYTLQYGPYTKTRTRINIGRSFGNYFIVFRIINDYIPELKDLGVEDEVIKWAEYPNGLFLLCGPTGTGKSTTLASIVYNILRTNKKKVITIEKPIEYIYPDDTPSLVVQREVGEDTRSFSAGLTSAMRQNPDIILLGEVRNTEEVTELLRAAETGHLAISTMHTNSVSTTLNRIQNLFTGNEQQRIMSTLSDTLRGIANQILVKDKEDGRFAVREILTINEEIRKYIVAGDILAVRDYQVRHKSTMEHKLAEAVLAGKCHESEARKQIVDVKLFNELLEG